MRIREILARVVPAHTRSLFQGMAVMAGGAAVARVISLGSAPLLTRIYSPADYGVLAVFVSSLAILAPLLNLRFAQAIPLPRRDRLAAQIVGLAITATAASGILVALILFLFADPLFRRLSVDLLGDWWWLLVIGAVAVSTYECFSGWATRRRAYAILARTTATQAIVGEAIKLSSGILGLRPLGLLLGNIANQSAGLSTLVLHFRDDVSRLRQAVSPRAMLRAALLYRAYPTLRLTSHLVLVLAMQAPVMLVSMLYGNSSAGQLGLALATLAIPASLLGDNISRAYYAEISKLGRRQPIAVRKITRSVLIRLAGVAVPCAFPLMIWGEEIFSFVFGQSWNQAGQLAATLSIYLVSQFIQKPASFLLFLFDGQRQLLYINLQRLVLTIGVFFMASGYGISLATAVLIYSLVLSAHYALSIVVALRKIPRPEPHNG